MWPDRDASLFPGGMLSKPRNDSQPASLGLSSGRRQATTNGGKRARRGAAALPAQNGGGTPPLPAHFSHARDATHTATPRRLAPATPSAFLRGTAAARCSSARSAGLRCLPVVVRAALPGSRRSPGAGQRGLIALRARADVRVRYSGRDVMAI
ncbi:hypothetical protein SEVIR_1G192633v4 [Setaria viridis]